MKWFEIPTDLAPKLRELQNADLEYGGEIIRAEDAIVMTLGLGSSYFLTFDGRVFVDDWMDEDPPREATTIVEATTALAIGAHMRNMPELLEMLPSRTQGARDCQNCSNGWQDLGEIGKFICEKCGGLGWTGIE